MDDNTLKNTLVGLAALLHDIGKAYQRSGKKLSSKYKNTEEWQILLNKYSHYHSLHTAEFFDNQIENSYINKLWSESFPEISMQKASAGHHNPQDYLTQIVAISDQIASGFDRERYEIRSNKKPYDYRKVHLAPLLKHVSLQKDIVDKDYRYNLEEISVNSIFPVHKNELSNIKVEEKYENLVNNFEKDLKKIFANKKFDIFISEIQTIFEKYFSFVPSSTLDEYDEISLFDHSKTSAAFAASTYDYFSKENLDKLNYNQIKDKNLYMLIRGEFFGIQKFIFGDDTENSQNTAKALRGKSFYVSILSQLTAYHIIKEIKLPSFNIMLNAAGMFVILAPNKETVKQKIKDIKAEINDWLYDTFYGEVSFGIVNVESSPKDYIDKRFEKLWLDLISLMEHEKYAKFNLTKRKSLFEDYHKEFDVSGSCNTCGKRSATNNNNCEMCNTFIDIGKQLVNNRYLHLYEKKKGEFFQRYSIKFSNEIQLSNEYIDVLDLEPLKSYEGGSIVYINNYVPKNNYEIMSFEEIVENNNSERKKPLGILKADVDNLVSPEKLDNYLIILELTKEIC
ncbi:type III-A CRISPR-associated protein Cas10/Csm1 [Flexistipes sinusarabici]|uniref:type III-A CRISPR-associated protein Cas10/Csm1 n=1 Tax=Flexistipes sinusarabici TaxID=2352 RepID=UPI0002D47207|nr:type III-A CRISPR-associated protein Cas10/Csm1 [Flexistipes sinusarabici]